MRTDEDFNKALNEADKVVHPVEKQWHYPIMIANGFEPVTKLAVGFVRRYEYKNKDGRRIACCTGCNSDYFNDMNNGHIGYCRELEIYLKSL